VAAESTCEREAPAGHYSAHGHGRDAHRHHIPVPAGIGERPDEPPIDCDEVRVVAPVKRVVDDGSSQVVAIMPLASPAIGLAIESVPDEPDWQARDPHARRALWQVYRM
jgi:hypothetical protein